MKERDKMIRKKLLTDEEIDSFIGHYVTGRFTHSNSEIIKRYERIIRENRIENENLAKIIAKLK